MGLLMASEGIAQHRIYPVGPGVIHHDIYQSEGPWAIHVLQVDLRNPYIVMETVKAGNRLIGREKTSGMAARQSHEEHRVIGAINGDFFSQEGVPVGVQVIAGELLKDPDNHSVFGMFTTKRPFIEILRFQGKVITRWGYERIIHGINRSRGDNELILYNRFMGARTGTKAWGAECRLRTLSEWVVNDTVWVVVTAVDSTTGNQPIPSGGAVLSGHGTSRRWLLDHVVVGDTLALLLQLLPLEKPVREAIGGLPRIVRDGHVSVEEGVGSFATARHPRTAVGFSRDSTQLYLVTVDGRQPNYSVGMSLYELAEFLIDFGAYQAINLDGGGSTTMVVRDSVVNRPSDATGERPVANALLVVSTAPTGPLAILRIQPDSLRLYRGRSWRFEVQGFDSLYNPLDMSQQTVTWNCEPHIGSIDPINGLFSAGTTHDSGYVWATCEGLSDSAFVVVDVPRRILLYPNPLYLAVGEEQAMVPRTLDTGGHLVSLPASEYTWRVQGSIGQIDPQGRFKALQEGTGIIEACLDSIRGVARAYVGLSGTALLDSFNAIGFWKLSGKDVRLQECRLSTSNSIFLSPPASLRLDYSFIKSGGTAVLYLEQELPIGGRPDAIGLAIYGDGRGHGLQAEFVDADGETFFLDIGQTAINWAGEWRDVSSPLSRARPSWENPTADLDPPITLKRLKLFLAGGIFNTRVTGTLFFDDLKATYTLSSAKGEIRHQNFPSYQLFQNYPNPFQWTADPGTSPLSTRIRFQLPQPQKVELYIFNPLGQRIRTLLREKKPSGEHVVFWNGRDDQGHPVPAGVYFCALRGEGFYQVRKMVVLP